MKPLNRPGTFQNLSSIPQFKFDVKRLMDLVSNALSFSRLTVSTRGRYCQSGVRSCTGKATAVITTN